MCGHRGIICQTPMAPHRVGAMHTSAVAGAGTDGIWIIGSACVAFGLVSLWALYEVFRSASLLRRHREQKQAISGARTRLQIHALLVVANALRCASMSTESMWLSSTIQSAGWWVCVSHMVPDLFFFVLYGLLILLWATLYYEVPSDGKWLTAGFWTTVALVCAGFGALAAYSWFVPNAAGVYTWFWSAAQFGLGGVYAVCLVLALFFGCKVAKKLQPEVPLSVSTGTSHVHSSSRSARSHPSSVATEDELNDLSAQRAVMRRVYILCGLCVVFFLVRGTLNIMAAAHVTRGYSGDASYGVPFSGSGHTFDVLSVIYTVSVFGVAELVPSLVMLFVTRNRATAAVGTYSASDLTHTHSSSMPDVLDATRLSSEARTSLLGLRSGRLDGEGRPGLGLGLGIGGDRRGHSHDRDGGYRFIRSTSFDPNLAIRSAYPQEIAPPGQVHSDGSLLRDDRGGYSYMYPGRGRYSYDRDRDHSGRDGRDSYPPRDGYVYPRGRTRDPVAEHRRGGVPAWEARAGSLPSRTAVGSGVRAPLTGHGRANYGSGGGRGSGSASGVSSHSYGSGMPPHSSTARGDGFLQRSGSFSSLSDHRDRSGDRDPYGYGSGSGERRPGGHSSRGGPRGHGRSASEHSSSAGRPDSRPAFGGSLPGSAASNSASVSAGAPEGGSGPWYSYSDRTSRSGSGTADGTTSRSRSDPASVVDRRQIELHDSGEMAMDAPVLHHHHHGHDGLSSSPRPGRGLHSGLPTGTGRDHGEPEDRAGVDPGMLPEGSLRPGIGESGRMASTGSLDLATRMHMQRAFDRADSGDLPSS